MKNKLQGYLIILFFLLQNAILFGQTSTADLRLVADRAPIDDAHLYIPDNGDPLSLWEQSDFKFSIDTRERKGVDYYDFSPSNNSATQIKLAYSFLPKFYATASFFQSKGDVYMSGNYNERLLLGDVGIGAYLLKIDEKDRYTPFLKYNSKWMMKKGVQVNALLGYSRAKIEHEKSYLIGQSKFNFNRFYGQMGFHFQRGMWGFSGNAKGGVLNYRDVKIYGKAASDLEVLSSVIMKQNNFLFIETAMRFYLGTKFGQVYLNRVYAKTDAALLDYTITEYTSVGVVLNIQGFIKATKKDKD